MTTGLPLRVQRDGPRQQPPAQRFGASGGCDCSSFVRHASLGERICQVSEICRQIKTAGEVSAVIFLAEIILLLRHHMQ